MKPDQAYQSLAKAKSKIGLILFLCLLAQIFYYSLSTFRVALPSRIVEAVIDSFLPEELAVRVSSPRIIGLRKVEFGSFNLWFQQTNLLKLNDLSISLNPFFEPQFLPSIIEGIALSGGHILPSANQRNDLEFSQLLIEQKPKKNLFFVRSKIGFGPIQTNFVFHSRDLPKIIKQTLTQKNKDPIDLAQFVQEIILVRDNITNWTQHLPPINLNIVGDNNEQSVRFHIKQIVNDVKNQPYIRNFSGIASFDLISASKPFLECKTLAIADQMTLLTKTSSLRFNNLKFSNEGRYFLNDSIFLNKNSFLSFKSLETNGKLVGKTPPISLHSYDDQRRLKLQCFSESNGTRISISFLKRNDQWRGSGFLELSPISNDFQVQLPQGDLKILKGENLAINLYANPTPIITDSPVQFIIKADEFSALETPAGDFFIKGEVAHNFSIFIHHAYGKLGLSEVTGTYYQKWQPAEYRFLVEGTCHPPDINNWLGVWWSPIWKDFSFSEEIPKGNFSIHGIWGGEPGNSVTIGEIKTKKLGYRNFQLQNSLVNISVDGKSTRLDALSLTHNQGTVQGSLVFPRSLEKSSTLLSFGIKGEFPLNEGKSIFGKEVQDALTDFNVTSLFCSGNGTIRKEELPSTDKNKSKFELYLSADEPFSYAGVNFDYAQGHLKQEDGLIRADFDDFGINEGTGSLFISETSVSSDHIAVSLDLKNADRSNFFENLSQASRRKSADQGLNTKLITTKTKEDGETGGKISFSIKAEGPISDLKHFEGTGNAQIHDVDIGSIHILGGIRNKLGAFNIPLPSDALNFNKLEAPFKLEYDRISFDQATLSGPLSKFTANGVVDWVDEQVDLLAKFQVAGNLNIPILKQIVNLADPLSKLSKLKIQGHWDDPDWSIYLGANPLSP